MNDGAEVYAILMGFHELCKLGGHNPIIEGNSFSALKCGLGKARDPWKSADWEEKIQ